MGAERIAIAPEGTYGTNPGSGFIYYPFTSDDLAMNLQVARSAEVNTNRNPRGANAVGNDQGGGFAWEAKLGVMNPLFEGMMLDAFSSDLGISGTIDATASDNSFNSTTLFGSVVVGQWVKVSNLHASVNGWHKVTSKPSSSKIIVATDITGDQTGDGDETMGGSYVRIGTTLKSFSIEKQWPTQTIYQLMLGMVVQNLSFTAEVGSLLNGRIGFLGKPQASTNSSGAGSPTAAASNEILSPVDDVPAVYVDGFAAAKTSTELLVSRFGFDWNNRFTSVQALGQLGAVRVEQGIPDITATLRADMTSTYILTLLQAYEARTRTSIAVRLSDGTRSMIVTFPQVLIERMPTQIGGNEGQRFADLSLVPEEDSTGVAAQIDYFAS